MLRSSGMTSRDAVQRAAKLYGLAEHLDEAVADVARGLDALRAAGLARSPAADLQLEYPGPWTDGQLASGYIDLVAVEDGRVDIIDFKTDAPSPGPVEQTYPKYAAQVRIYGKLFETAGILKDLPLRCGLLFTADGSIRWIEP
jgi:ATP-dependent exoDNAse (exonuclease V) beta subunit